MEPWERKLRSYLLKRARNISYEDSIMPSRRVDGEFEVIKSFTGFRSAILYFQLSPELSIDKNFIQKIVALLRLFIYPRRPEVKPLAVFFFNNKDYHLQYPVKMFNDPVKMYTTIQTYFENYVDTNEIYSRLLKELFPEKNPYNLFQFSPDKFPTIYDLCLIFHDKDGFLIDPQLLPIIERCKENFIWIYSSKNHEKILQYGEIPEFNVANLNKRRNRGKKTDVVRLANKKENKTPLKKDNLIKEENEHDQKEEDSLKKRKLVVENKNTDVKNEELKNNAKLLEQSKVKNKVITEWPEEVPADLFLFLKLQPKSNTQKTIEIKYPGLLKIKQKQNGFASEMILKQLPEQTLISVWKIINEQLFSSKSGKQGANNMENYLWELKINALDKRLVSQGEKKLPIALEQLLYILKNFGL